METLSRSLSKSLGEFLTSSSNHFSRRSDSIDDHDEEALKWAALEKLSTFTRLRTTLIQPHDLVDVTKLGVDDRQKFIDSIFKVTEEDNEKFLKKLRKRIDRVGIKLPTVEVRFEKFTIEADCHIGKRALPTLPNVALNIAGRGLSLFGFNFAKTTKLTILRDASGIIKPSRMTLLLGPPSSGKTTLLLALAGKLDPSLKVTGRVTYNGYGLGEIVPQKTSAYISQNDVHIGVMTVQETLDFSARCQGIGTRYDLLSELVRREKDAGILPEPEVDLFMKSIAAENVKSSLITDYTLKILGLDICKDTVVGDEMIRGISGGQKKRVTTGEMIVGPTKTLFMDEISTGLDSSTTYQIVKCLKEMVRFTDATVLMSLLQPAPETFELFDDIILLSEGQIVYQGPRDHILSFFETCGFKCPERKGTADFLQESCLWKQWITYWRTPDYNLARFFFTFFAALMVGSIFWKVGTTRDSANDLTKVIGAMYAAVLFVGINNATSVQPLVAVERTVFYRERAAEMYSALPYALAQVVCEIPFVLIQTTYYTLITYAMMCFEWTVVKFFWFFFVSFFSFLYFTYYGMMAVAITPNQQVAAIFAGAFYGLFNLFSGFLIPRPRIPKWWIWYYWMCPVAWTVYGLIVSQYGDQEDTIKVPGMTEDPTIKWYIENHYGYDPNFMGSIAAVLVGFTVFFAFMFAFGIKMLNFQQR
ncbi:hypothetical protein BRARA_E02519 [Brassica rapa]|uniref:ABC transporter domain-containing protein n=1 Tax=Brassica campestris TaxID=3711 RepID=A0A397ZEX3_BRACM|nr:hypothetical protein BRARA_E02519 [Brassica rapa]